MLCDDVVTWFGDAGTTVLCDGVSTEFFDAVVIRFCGAIVTEVCDEVVPLFWDEVVIRLCNAIDVCSEVVNEVTGEVIAGGTITRTYIEYV